MTRQIILENQRIINFYDANPSIDPIAINIAIINLIEPIIQRRLKSSDDITNILLGKLSVFDNNLSSLKQNVESLYETTSQSTENMNMIKTELLTNVSTNIKDTNTTIETTLCRLASQMSENMNMIKTELLTNVLSNIKDTNVLHNATIETTLCRLASQMSENMNMIKTELLTNVSSNIKDTNVLHNATIETTLYRFVSQLTENMNSYIRTIMSDSTLTTSKDLSDTLDLFQKQFIYDMKNTLTEHLTSCNINNPIINGVNESERRIMVAVEKIISNTSQNEKTNSRLADDLHDICNRFKNSSNKGKLGETHLENILNMGFPTAEIVNTSGERASCDFKIMRTNKPTVLIETKEYTRNVNKEEVIKFIRDIKECKTHGIFLSQHSGIANKQNFELNIIDGCIVVYIHNVEYSIDYIRMALRAIDELHPFISKSISDDTDDNDMLIKKEEIDQISNDYTSFVQKKVSMIESSKTFMKIIIKDMENLEIPSLKYLLQTRSGLNTTPEKTSIEKEQFTCSYCNRSFGTNRGKQMHENKCGHKPSVTKTNEIDSEHEQNMITQL